MATISLTDPIAGTTATAGQQAGNNAALRTAINGGLDNTNVAGGAAIDQTKIAFTAYQAFAVAWTSTGTAPALGNAVIVSRYQQIGKSVHYYGSITFGTTSTYGTGTYLFSMPLPTLNSGVYGEIDGYDTSANARAMAHGTFGTTASNFQAIYPTTWPGGAAVAFGQLVPWTWATGDIIAWNLRYETT